jgi:leader peptidase (prepilin peptidase)/N-methyltransferase
MYLDYILVAIFGAIFGSYSTIFIHRLPIGDSCFGRFFGKKSHCPSCNHIMTTKELIPVFNWIITMGKCKKCKIPIPKRYLFAEISSIILFLYNYHIFSFSEEFILYSLFSICCLILIIIDWNHKKLSNHVIYAALLISVSIRILRDGQILDLILYCGLAIFFAAIFFQFLKSKLFFKENNLDNDVLLQYSLILLISSIILPPAQFLLYFILIIVFLSISSYIYRIILKKDIYLGFYQILSLLFVIFIN